MVDWLPSLADVGSVIPTRTKNLHGKEIGTFTTETRPTAEQVEASIDTAVTDVESAVGTVPDGLQPRARRVAAIGAALLVELSWFPEQGTTNRSPYQQLKEWYDQMLERLINDINDVNAGGEVGGEDGVLSPLWAFPDCEGMIGLGTPL